MSNKDLFKEAIADAKAVREAALANAKAALEEALAPKLQSMLAAKLQEMDNEDLDEAKDKEEVEEGFYPDVTGDLGQDAERAKGFALEEGDEEELEEDFDLSSILAELSKSEEELDEAKKKEDKEEMDEAKKEDLDEAEEAEEEEEEEEEEESEEDESESDDKITDLTVDELKDIIKDIISAEMGGGEAPEMDDMSADMGDMGGEEEMAVDIDGEMEGETEEIAEEDYDSMDEIDLEELLAELDSLDEADEDDIYEAKKKDDKKKKEDKEDMKEAIDTIEALRNELHEVNLLNAKLLYVNKVFKAKNLTESQKLKVIAQFDKAETPAEAKAIFESMNAAIEKSKKSIVKESLGFASKAAGVAPKKPIVEVDATVSRWQMLAGINKF
jgi:hypothetical protein